MIQVLIPTRRRPQFLRNALESVRSQTAIDKIGNVVVSENGSCEESREVCESFPDLPITYILRSPELSAIDHGRVLAEIDTQPYTAILHDDDWWHGAHLETALRGLAMFPSCNASYSSYLDYAADRPPMPGPGTLRVWVANGCAFDKQVFHLSFPRAMMANLLMTSFHYSTLVCRTTAYKEAVRVALATENSFDNDRMVPMLLGYPEGLVYSTMPLVAVRYHGDQHWREFSQQTVSIMAETTRWNQRRWPAECAEAAAIFNATADVLSADVLQRLSQPEPLLSTLVNEVGFHRLKPSFGNRCMMLMKSVTPPFMRPLLGATWQAIIGFRRMRAAAGPHGAQSEGKNAPR